MSKKGIIVPGSESTNLTKGGGSYFSHKRSVIFKRFVKIHLRTLAHQVIKEIKRNIFYEVYFLLLLQKGITPFLDQTIQNWYIKWSFWRSNSCGFPRFLPLWYRFPRFGLCFQPTSFSLTQVMVTIMELAGVMVNIMGHQSNLSHTLLSSCLKV